MELAKVGIETNDSPIVSKWKIYINGMDITRSVRGIELFAYAGEAAGITLKLLANVELPNEFSALARMDELEPIGDMVAPEYVDTTAIGDAYKTRMLKNY